MPTLLDDRIFEEKPEIEVEEFDLERLARISEVEPAIEAPPAPRRRSRVRRTLVMALLALIIVGGLATLGPVGTLLAGSGVCDVAE